MKNKILFPLLIVVVALVLVFVYFSSKKLDINSFSFSCNVDSDCQLVGIECCNNNEPWQNTCLSTKDARRWKDALQNYCNKNQVACPEIYMLGNYSCSCVEGKCWTNFTTQGGVVMYSGKYSSK